MVGTRHFVISPLRLLYYKVVINIATQLNDLTLTALTPHNLLTDTNIQGIIYALDPELKAVTQDIKKASFLTRIDELDEATLDILAWQFHADFYDLAATLDMKRRAVANALKLHMKKGTVWAIKEALRQLDITAEYVPWWETDSEPYTFTLRAIVGGEFYKTAGRDVLIENINRAIQETQSARSVMTELITEIPDTQSMNIYLGIVHMLSGELFIYPKPPEPPDSLLIPVGVARALDGWQIIGLNYVRSMYVGTQAAVIHSVSTDIEIGVDLDTMQELLLQFESRIVARINEKFTEQNTTVNEAISTLREQVLTRLDDIEAKLKWSGDDETL